ncbi:single-stranded DNA-binding protein [Micrococcus sp.]|uniref:single-stranded DNA-binding protein n=1 Tax=Micrococcus sp. TaxID=1271 RepID=UPI0026DBEF31|nr:single-stranded DNA-binding protein [Micrococcus sp.]MDO4240786.1 single-stranded DNA-binding protein [Micrococcus sp.]
MQDTITIRGFVATDPATRHTASGSAVVGFRLATTERRFDRDAGMWVDAHTNWYSVSAFGQLGANTAQSVKKGNPVIVTGRLRVRDWSTDERSGTSVDVVADAVGLDLGYGSSAFMRNMRPARAEDQGPGGAARPDGEDRDDAGRDGSDGFDAPLPEAFRGGDAPAAGDGPEPGRGQDREQAGREVAQPVAA